MKWSTFIHELSRQVLEGKSCNSEFDHVMPGGEVKHLEDSSYYFISRYYGPDSKVNGKTFHEIIFKETELAGKFKATKYQHDGSVVVLFPADHVLWSKTVADIANWLVKMKQEKSDTVSWFQLWVLGDFSAMAQAELQKAGWELHPKAQKILFPGKNKT